MQVLTYFVTLLSAAVLTFAKPYQYSYYISLLPGQYQTLEVNDGTALVNGIPQYTTRPVVNPDFRQGRGYNNPELGRRFPAGGRNEPDFVRGRGDPFYRDSEPFYNEGRQYPQRPFDRRFNQDPYNSGFGGGAAGRRFPQDNFGNQFDPSYAGRRGPQDINDPYYGGRRDGTQTNNFSPYAKLVDNKFERYKKAAQEIDESTTTSESREEVATTEQPCTFCGVAKVNPRDQVNPDSEPVEPKNVVVNAQPPFAIANNAVTPSGAPGYVPYFVIL